jgi:hydrogenase nickel incorporation protein HypB
VPYPTIFNTADVAIVTRIDLAETVAFDRDALIRNVENGPPEVPALRSVGEN